MPRRYSSLAALALGITAATSATALAQPDLTIRSIEVTGADRFSDLGQTRTIAVRTANDGDATARNTAVGLYLSRDAVFSGDDCFLEDQVRINTISPTRGGRGGFSSGVVLLPEDEVVGGDYFVLAVIDYEGTVAETDETNNVAAVPVTLRGTAAADCGAEEPAPFVDFALLGLTIEADDRLSEPGGRVSLDYAVRNNSDLAYSNLYVGFYLSRDRAFDGEDVFLEGESLSTIRSGEVESEFEQISLPDEVDGGDYFILAVVDPNDRLAEADEANNVDSAPIVIEAPAPPPPPTLTGADLVFNRARASLSGNRLTVDFRVRNTGTESADGFFVTFGLRDEADDEFGSTYFAYAYIRRLPAGRQRRITGTLTIPSSRLAGKAFVLAKADFTDVIGERDESNNVAAAAIGGALNARGGGDNADATPVVAGRIDTEAADTPPLSVAALPNPASELLTFRFAEGGGAYEDEVGLSIYDVHGREILGRSYAVGVPTALDVSALPAGVYVARLRRGGATAVTRFVVEH